MALSRLDIELGKIDMKFGKAEFLESKPKLEFFIRYCHPIAIYKPGDGIAVAIRRFKEDRLGGTGMFLIERPYPYSLEGLDKARSIGLAFARDLYNLENIIIEERVALPDANYFDDNKIYRINLDFNNIACSGLH